jgi:hypothetical protein
MSASANKLPLPLICSNAADISKDVEKVMRFGNLSIAFARAGFGFATVGLPFGARVMAD